MKHRHSNKLPDNIPQLQNLIKRDPASYYDEFYRHYKHFQSLMEILKLKPEDYNETLENLTMFMAQVSSYYSDFQDFPKELVSILRTHHTVLDPCMRLTFCRALILLRNRGLLEPSDLITLCFELLHCQDKMLRNLLQTHIITDVKNLNAHHKNAKVNTVLQNFMFKMLSDSNRTAVKMSLDIMIELYKKNAWKDEKTVNAIATACFSKFNKVLVAAHQFFLSIDEYEESDDSDSDDDKPTVKEVMFANRVNKKSKKRLKILKRTQQVLKRKKKSKKETFDFSAIHLLHDPQGLAEKLLKAVEVMNERFEIKMMMMNLVSRLIGVHSLVLFNFYVLLQRYIQPHQRDVTKILMFAAQATHDLVPPDVIEPVLKCIVNNFVTERNNPQVMTVGINSVREICIRCPLAMNTDLLDDLAQYKKYRDKNVSSAAKSLIVLYRKINPKMLHRKYRVKPTEAMKELIPLEFGALQAKSYIPGAEVLPVEGPIEAENDENHSDEESDDGSWENVSHSDDDIAQVKDFGEEGEEPSESGNKVDNDRNSEKISNEDQIQDLKEKATVVSHSRFLSQEEFRQLKVAEVAKEVQFIRSASKRKAMEESDMQRGEIVSLGDIERLSKKIKQSKEERRADVMEGREDREKFGARKQKRDVCSKTNVEHNKKKTFNMIKHKMHRKVKRSFREKQISLRKSLLRWNKNK